MTNIFVPGVVECPLCRKAMKEIVTPKGIMLACFYPRCMVSIRKDDPAVGR